MNRAGRFFWIVFLLLAPQVVRGADQRPPAASPGVARAIALETTRQDMIQSRLDELLARFHQLAADLHSNPAVGGDAEKVAERFEARLRTIRSGELARARGWLGQALRDPSAAAANMVAARAAIDRAARELASLVLCAGMSPAAEVFAREIRDLIDREELLQREAMAALGSAAESGESQTVVAKRLSRLLTDVAALPDTQTDALAAVRIIRTRKLIEAGRAVAAMESAAADLGRQAAAEAARSQTRALAVLREAEVRLRADARLESLVRTRNMLEEALAGQRRLRDEIGMLAAAEFSEQRLVWERRQRALALPLAQIDSGLGVNEQVRAAAKAAADAAQGLAAGERAGAVAEQEQLETAMGQLLGNLQKRIADAQGLSTAYRRLQEATSRVKHLQDIVDRHGSAATAATGAVKAKKGLEEIAELQRRLAEEIGHFAQNLPADSRWSGVLRRPLAKASQRTAAVATALKDRKLAALDTQLTAASSALSDAVTLAKREIDYLDATYTLRQLAGDMREITRSLADIEDEERDLLGRINAKTGAKTPQELAITQDLLGRAVEEADLMVGVIAEAASLKPHLDLARKAMSDAAAQLRESRREVAAASAVAAGEELKNARKLAADLAAKAQYLAEMTANLEQLSANAADLLERQIALREKTESAERAEFAFITGEQDVLQGEATVLSEVAVPTAADAYQTAAKEMGLALEQLKQVHREQAVVHQILAEKALRLGIDELQKYLAALKHLAQNIQMEGDLDKLNLLSRVLFLAIQEKDLCDETRAALETALPPLAPKQIDLKKEAVEVSESPGWTRPPGSSHLAKAVEHIKSAIDEMDKVTGSLEKSSRQPAVDHEQAAEKYLRMAFADVVLTMFEPAEEELLNKPMKFDPDQIILDSYEHWASFEKTDPGGAAVNRDRAERESLTDRDRAALNENFARELPLEYRQLLKDYYETLAK